MTGRYVSCGVSYMPACISLILDIRPPARPGVPPSWCAGGDNFGVMINALKHILKQFEQAWRHGAGDPDDEDAPGEYSHVKEGGVKVLVDALKAHLGGTKDEAGDKAAAFAKTKRTNPFAANQRLQLPWNKIEKNGMKNLRAHCTSFLGLPP